MLANTTETVPNTAHGCNHQSTCMPQLQLSWLAALAPNVAYYPGGMKALVSHMQWSKPYSILAPTQDLNPGGWIQNHKRWPLLHYQAWLDGSEVSALGWRSGDPRVQSHPRQTFQSCSRYQLNQLGNKTASESTFKKSNTCRASNTRPYFFWLPLHTELKSFKRNESIFQKVANRCHILWSNCTLVPDIDQPIFKGA